MNPEIIRFNPEIQTVGVAPVKAMKLQFSNQAWTYFKVELDKKYGKYNLFNLYI